MGSDRCAEAKLIVGCLPSLSCTLGDLDFSLLFKASPKASRVTSVRHYASPATFGSMTTYYVMGTTKWTKWRATVTNRGNLIP